MVKSQFVLALFFTEAFAVWTKYFPRFRTKVVPMTPSDRGFEKTPSIESSEVLDDYYSVKKKLEELNVVSSQVHQINSNNVRFSHFFHLNGRTILVLKTIKHRNKRYTSYLTLCPFKICNMGRKRTVDKRFFSKIKLGFDNKYSS